MSSLVSTDAPLLDSQWDQLYRLPSPPPSESTASPALSAHMLKRMSPDHLDDPDCLPTHQLFELDAPAKRTPSPAPDGAAKKQCAPSKRISSKDFVPPDVSGLSKREARLVKNRAAAFLSRQRKREEFESMEVRVVQLEQDNARLMALAHSGTNGQANQSLLSEIETLRAQLVATQAREQQLSSELAKKSSDTVTIKTEDEEPDFSFDPPPRSTPTQSPTKSGPSFGLMVLLCALPTLLSMPPQPSMSTTFSLPNSVPIPSTSFDFSSFLPSEYDWSRPSALPAFGVDDFASSSLLSPVPTSGTRKLQFSDSDGAASGLSGLDVSFDTSPTSDGKIRVKIHPTSSPSSSESSPGIWEGADTLQQNANSVSSYVSGSSDPFLGLGPQHHAPSPMTFETPTIDQDIDYKLGSEYTIGNNYGGKRRVRIALKSMPSSNGDGGEWEVEMC